MSGNKCRCLLCRWLYATLNVVKIRHVGDCYTNAATVNISCRSVVFSLILLIPFKWLDLIIESNHGSIRIDKFLNGA